MSSCVGHEARRFEPRLGGVELGVGPGPRAHVGAAGHAPVELGEQPDLGGVVAGGHPGGDVAVAAELAQLVAETEQVAERRARQALGEGAGEERPAPRLERRDGAGEELVGAIDAVGRRAEDALELADRPVEASRRDGRSVGERPAEGRPPAPRPRR